MDLGFLPGGAKQWAAAGALTAVVTTGVVACAMTVAPPPTARVERATVSVSVSASGALSAVQAQNLGFAKGGQVKELTVKVGDVVTPGQVLARVDDFAARQALSQAQARLAQQQAQLDKIVNGNSVEAAQASLDQARRILDATEANAEAQDDAAEKATFRAEKQLEFDESQLEKAKAALAACRKMNPPPTDATACASQQQAVNMAKANVVMDQTALSNAREQEQVTETQGRVSIENARQGVVTAQNNLDTARRNNPADIAAQQAAVRDAAVSVRLAQQDVANTVLTAPIGGTVASINGAVGEFVGNGTSATPLAPGSGAAIPGVSPVSAGQGGAAEMVSAPGGSNFIVLGDVNSFQVVVPFEESDAAKVAPNQRVEVTFDALPDLTLPGTVLAVAPSGTAISGVTNYYVTVVLNQSDPQLRDRQTAQANVLTSAVDNVLSVPNAAVIREGGQSFVTIPGADGQPKRIPFESGLVGDDRTEVKSGLSEGQEVQLPSATVVASPENQRPPR